MQWAAMNQKKARRGAGLMQCLIKYQELVQRFPDMLFVVGCNTGARVANAEYIENISKRKAAFHMRVKITAPIKSP